MVSSTSDNGEARAWARECGAVLLAAPLADVASLGSALRARTDRSVERGVFADLAIASWLETHAASTIDLATLAHAMMQRGLPRHAGAVPRRQLLANAWVSGAMREALSRVLPRDLELVPEVGVIAFAHLWDSSFCNSLSPLHLVGRGSIAREPSDPLIVRSMFQPFATPDDVDIAAIWTSDSPMALKLLLALWTLALPVHEVDAASVSRVVRHVTALCPAMTAHPPAQPFALAICYALCSALFRAAYTDVDHTPALSAAGDFAASVMQRQFPAFATPRSPRPARDRPRIGYVSSNFRTHPVTLYMGSRIFDRSPAHEVITFVLGTRRDALTERVVAASDRVVSLPQALDYATIAHAVVDEDLDLLIFPDIGMDLPTFLLAGLHLAPRQVVMMGHAASSGMPTLSHYLGGDHESDDASHAYRERLIRLPVLGAAQQAPAPPAGTYTRARLGIPDDAVVFVNCSNAIKHGVERDDSLSKILETCPNAWLVLKPFFHASEVDPRITARILDAAARNGVADRVVIVPPVANIGEVMDLYALADVQLDTYPFGGWTTNLEALFVGLPLVTREGNFGRNRFGAAMLRALGITEGIAHTEDEYIAAGVRLGTDDALRAALRTRILASRSVLFAPSTTQRAYELTLAELLL